MYNGENKNGKRKGMDMGRFKSVMKWIGKALCLIGCLWFLMPFLHGGFALGAVFGFCVCVLGFLLLTFYPRLADRGGWRKAAVRLISAFYVIGLLWTGYLTGLMFSAQFHTPPQGVNVIVLGAQVCSAERMGVSLQGRVDAAADYLKENPEAKCIVTGGQGSDEPCPEAVTEKNVLTRAGIGGDRIFLEDKSRNTRENMNFAKRIAEENGLGTEFAVVTQSFHMYRALKLAESAGFTPYSLVADTDWILFPEYYGRELLSLTKWHVQRLVLG